jgi:uncharacterized protein YecE (DUF72 family)
MRRTGIGGWTSAPWRGTFYPKDLKQADELHFASRAVTAIEINGTFYRTQSPASFRKWREETPEGFVFSVKGHRAVVNGRDLAAAGEPIAWFLRSGILELGDKLGPILWQFPPYRKFDREVFGRFLDLLPQEKDGRRLMHVLEVRSESFLVPEFVALLAEHNAAVAYADSDEYPAIADVTADFAYARLQRASEAHPTGYAEADLDRWAARAKSWEAGRAPDDLPTFGPPPAAASPGDGSKRPVFVTMINGDKVRAPAAATALINRLGD